MAAPWQDPPGAFRASVFVQKQKTPNGWGEGCTRQVTTSLPCYITEVACPWGQVQHAALQMPPMSVGGAELGAPRSPEGTVGAADPRSQRAWGFGPAVSDPALGLKSRSLGGSLHCSSHLTAVLLGILLIFWP